MAMPVAVYVTPGHAAEGLVVKNQSEHDAVESDDTNSSSDDDSDDADSDDNDQEDDRPGFVTRVRNAVQAKQQRLLEARRDPVLEWKETNRWMEHNAASVAKAEREKVLRKLKRQEKAAVRERKQKRKAQQRLTKQKEIEFRTLLQDYDDALVKSDKRRDLLTKFTIETHIEQKKRQVEHSTKTQLEAEHTAARHIQDAIDHDITAKQEEISHVQQVIDTSDIMGRRCGILPAINTPAPIEVNEQDETSPLVILRVNQATSEDNALSSPQQTDSRSAIASVSPIDVRRGSPMIHQSRSSSNAKRLFFTVNLKRFKHADQIRGEGIGDHGGKELARSLLTGACPRVKRIYLGWNHIKYPGIAAMADAFIRGACGQLQVLDLRCNCVDATAFDQLITVFEKDGLPELVELILQGNTLGDEGAKTLAHALLKGTLKPLQVIDVRQNRIRNAGALAIWNVFTAQTAHRYCPKLQLLDLRRNEAQGALTRSFCPCPSFLEF